MNRQRNSGPVPMNADEAVNLALDLESIGEAEEARRVLEDAAKAYPAALARAAAMRAAAAELRAPIAPSHTDLTARVLDQWEREELLAPQSHGTRGGQAANEVYELADSAARPTDPSAWGTTGTAAGADASHARHRRSRGRRRGREWTALLAAALGLSVAVGLYATSRPAPTAPPPAAPHTAAAVNAAPPPASLTARSHAPLRLGNALAYDHVDADTIIASRPARLRYGAAPDAGTFAGLHGIQPGPAPERVLIVPLADFLGEEPGDAQPTLLDPARLRLNAPPPEPDPSDDK